MQRAALAGLLLAVLAVPVAHADVTVRVEGQSKTLLPRTAVTQSAGTDAATTCPGDSASAAIERATNGNWDRQPYITTILGESHDFSNSDAWGVWVFRGGLFKVSNGVCTERLAAGEELLVSFQVFGANFAPTLYPLWVTDVPATVTTGVPFTVTINQAACETSDCLPGEGHRVAGAGATVTAGDATATAGPDGKATLTVTKAGSVTVRATAAGANPSAAEPVTVSDPLPPGVTPTPTPATTAVPTATLDTRPPYSSITGIKEQQTFRKGKGPRTLTARVDEPVAQITLGLTRQVGRKCWAFSDAKAKFVRSKCGRHPRFTAGVTSDLSYLLPARVAKGRYVLDVVSTDQAGNEEQLARGRNRVVFFVK